MTDNKLAFKDTHREKTVIKLYWVSAPPGSTVGYIEKMILPNSNELHFNHEKGIIDLEPLTEFLNYPCELYKDGEYAWLQMFTGLGEIDGVKCANFKTFEVSEGNHNGSKE